MSKQALVYIKDRDHAWIPGTIESQSGDKVTVSCPQYPDEQSMTSDGGRAAKGKKSVTVNLNDYPHKVLPLQNVDNNGMLLQFSDMVQLPYLHEAGIMYNLKQRHKDGFPYTRTGDIVIAVNPFQWFTHLYTEKQRTYYSNRLVWQDHEGDPREGMEPHVYECSSLSYKGLAFGGHDQSILVSGESGAGKTETVKICMNHMASVQKGPSSDIGDELDPVVKRVVQSNPLLEAFGNAKTRRNDNSSRFGKYLQLQFDNSEAALMALGGKKESKCKLAGSVCDVYLLEKNRVVGHDDEERSYHIFYCILASPEDEKKRIWNGLSGKKDTDFKYVGRSLNVRVDGMTDAEFYASTVETLKLIHVEGDKLIEMMRAICAVMQCGNLTFGALGGDNDKSEITSKDELKKLADLLAVGENDLTLAFTERTMKTKTETYKVPLNPQSAAEASDALAKEVYGNVFLWLVQEINSATCAEDNYKDGTMSKFGLIGLLDIFGFESFVVNRFEQLCINYANEKLQQKFTEDIFRSVQEEYEAEGIELAEIWYDDNTDVLDLIESRTGLLALLNEECVRPKGNDQDFVQKALQQNKDSPCLLVNKMDRMSFGVHHYAGKVMYDADGFVGRNTDNLPADLQELSSKSKNSLISTPVAQAAAEPAATSGRGAPKRSKSNLAAPTVWGKYKIQLASLMGNLRKTQSRYIRCIKPNMKKVPVVMEHVPTVEQLRCAGVVAAVTLSRSAFPNRLENTVVRYRYAMMWDPNKDPSKKKDGMDSREALRCDCEAILTTALRPKIDEKGNNAFVVGKTRSYFRAGALEYLEANRMENGLDEPATQIQKIARGMIIRKNWDKIVAEKSGALKRKQEEEERKRREAKEKAEAEARKKKEEEQKRLRAEQAAREKAEREERERQAQLEKERREQEERERIEREEEAAKAEIAKLRKQIKKLEKEYEETKKKNETAIANANEELEELEEDKKALEEKFDKILAEAEGGPTKDIEAGRKKIDDAEKIIAYLRKENKKLRDNTEKMKEDIVDLKEQNNRLIEANASAGASLDSLEKQKKNLQQHNVKLEKNLKKWAEQNDQLTADLANRTAYLKAETKIRAEYEKAMDKIIEILEEECDDADLLEEVTGIQLQCEALVAHKGAPGTKDDDGDEDEDD